MQYNIVWHLKKLNRVTVAVADYHVFVNIHLHVVYGLTKSLDPIQAARPRYFHFRRETKFKTSRTYKNSIYSRFIHKNRTHIFRLQAATHAFI